MAGASSSTRAWSEDGRRRKERRNLIARAQELADQLEPGLGLRGFVVFGSVARGDFNVWSDIDVLVVADHLPERWLDRIDVLGSPPTAGPARGEDA